MSALLPNLYARPDDLPSAFQIAKLPPMPYASGALLCPPAYFDVIDEKNPFMIGRAGTVDKTRAKQQWNELKAAIEGAGIPVRELGPLSDCEDMVFCANSAFLGIDADGRKTCAPSRMTHPSRRAEVGAIVAWCIANGYRIADLGDSSVRFEGGGDAIWHPGRRLIWGGYGWRTEQRIYAALSAAFGAPVALLALTSPFYYHLDTCFCPIDERTAIVYPQAIAPDGMHLIRRLFERVIDVDDAEAAAFACNAAPFLGRSIVIDRRAVATAARLRECGYEVLEVDTSEFLKSGGSAYCMKCATY